ncbi:hypothetical protein C8Q79DRAFT_1012854 [Trametes meyenii]|nr:hypothetical protein C8Q79DRAFT_1012854 [Trametes meyenii]
MIANSTSRRHHDDRPALSDSEAWALVQNKHGRITVQRRADGRPLVSTAFHFAKALFGGGAFAHLTRLSLLLDTLQDDEAHGHSRYDPLNDDSSLCADETFPNTATEREIVQLATQLKGRLVELRVTLCKPELVVPHIPLLVYDLADSCPSLRVLGVRDVQCERFVAPGNCTDDHVRYFGAIAYNEHREVASRTRSPGSRLRSLTIGRRQMFPHEHLCCSFVSQWLPRLEGELNAVDHDQYWADPTSHARLLATKRDIESDHLTELMIQEFPSLLEASPSVSSESQAIPHALYNTLRFDDRVDRRGTAAS